MNGIENLIDAAVSNLHILPKTEKERRIRIYTAGHEAIAAVFGDADGTISDEVDALIPVEVELPYVGIVVTEKNITTPENPKFWFSVHRTPAWGDIRPADAVE